MDLGWSGLVDLARAHLLPLLATLGAALLWCVGELFGRRSTWSQGAPKHPPKRMDRGTYPAIAMALGGSLLFSFLAFLEGWTGYLPQTAVAIGAGLVAVGVALRYWAMRTLGRFFTMPITIRPGHTVVRDGPYRWIRHPSYTGNFLNALGIAVLLGTPLGIIVTVALCLGIYVHRIRVEEGVLRRQLGAPYEAYTRETSRLFPGDRWLI